MRASLWTFGLSCFAAAMTASAGLSGCGHSVETATGGGGTSSQTVTSSTNASSAATGGGSHGDCMTDADCTAGHCAPITPGGYLICVAPPKEATACSTSGNDQCCATSDCPSPGAGCYEGKDLQFCGGALSSENQCIADECTTDADCPDGPLGAVCMPAGAFGLPKRRCIPAHCHVDGDCTAKPGGQCLLVGDNPCCTHQAPAGLGCFYPGGCADDAQCPDGACTLDPNGVAVCGPPHGGCPP